MPANPEATKPIRGPWLTFLRAVDQALEDSVEIHCIGGFALTVLVDRARATGDVDFIHVLPEQAAKGLLRIAGQDSPLAAEHHLHVQAVSVADSPCDYVDRLIDATPSGFRKLKIMILDPYDLVLTKAQRNFPKDRDDARLLIEGRRLDGDTLRNRFEKEVKPYLAVAADKTALTVELWLNEFFEDPAVEGGD